jgi:hypothetical protein
LLLLYLDHHHHHHHHHHHQTIWTTLIKEMQKILRDNRCMRFRKFEWISEWWCYPHLWSCGQSHGFPKVIVSKWTIKFQLRDVRDLLSHSNLLIHIIFSPSNRHISSTCFPNICAWKFPGKQICDKFVMKQMQTRVNEKKKIYMWNLRSFPRSG